MIAAYALLQAILACLFIGTGVAVGEAMEDPFLQASFPCEEDEVLGYSPDFGPDRVGCIHIDALKG